MRTVCSVFCLLSLLLRQKVYNLETTSRSVGIHRNSHTTKSCPLSVWKAVARCDVFSKGQTHVTGQLHNHHIIHNLLSLSAYQRWRQGEVHKPGSHYTSAAMLLHHIQSRVMPMISISCTFVMAKLITRIIQNCLFCEGALNDKLPGLIFQTNQTLSNLERKGVLSNSARSLLQFGHEALPHSG